MALCISRSQFRAAALRAVALACLPACLILAASCGQDTPTSGHPSDVGVLEGRITEAGLPIAASISFDNTSGEWPDVIVKVYADSTGWYRAELPLGLYRHRVRLEDASSPCCSSLDTVLVGRTVRRKDIALGRARVTVVLPSVRDGRRASLRLDSLRLASGYSADVLDETAVYDLRLLPAAGYTMRVSTDGNMESVYVPTADNPALVDTLRVGVDAVTERTIDFHGRQASIAGRVSTSALLREGQLRVEVVAVTGRMRGYAICDRDGSYRLDLLLPEPVRLRSSGGPVVRWFGGDAIGNATVHDPQPGDELTGVDQPAGILRVRFDGPGDLVENEAIVLMREEDGKETILGTSPRNPLVVGNLRPGRIRLFVVGGCAGQPWQPQWYDGAASLEGATILDLVDGQLTDVAMTLTGGGVITGTLSYTGDLWGVTVALRDASGGRICPTTVTVRGREFELPGLRDGDYTLALYLGSSPWWYPGTWSLNEATMVSIVDGGTVSGLVWPLPFPYGKSAP